MNRIYDAVYGYIELEDIEFKLVNSPIFQRLHWIKQLGPLNTVFPSAQHSRFSHSVGVFHIVSKMVEALKKKEGRYGYTFQKNEEKYLRYAALLHDIGHVPLSHIGESVLRESYSAGIDKTSISLAASAPRWTCLFPVKYWGPATKLHESLSVEMVLHNAEIDKILKKEWPNPHDLNKAKKKIAELIVGVGRDGTLSLLLHSELDADRLDYLLRDSFFTGVGYGHVDLEYVMSRLAVEKKDEDANISSLCFELKGIHTVEHCILGRFFLQTQVIYNRKVHLLDLLFMDVMGYMVKNGQDKKWGLMDLPEYLEHIQKSKGKDRHRHEHKIYEYTDAQVFVKMRNLHDKLDKKLKKMNVADSLKNAEAYMNDCIKTIMDGQVPGDVISHQKILDASVDTEEVNDIREKAKRIASETANQLNVGSERIKIDIIEQPVMKYRSNDDNREAVKITYLRDGESKTEYVAKSNASLLDGLVDKFLLIFFVYYIRSKNESDEDVSHKETVIKEAYQDFVLKFFQVEGMPCGCEEGEHLCQVIREDNGVKRVWSMASNPKYICRKCGRVADNKEHLCDGMAMSVDSGLKGQ